MARRFNHEFYSNRIITRLRAKAKAHEQILAIYLREALKEYGYNTRSTKQLDKLLAFIMGNPQERIDTLKTLNSENGYITVQINNDKIIQLSKKQSEEFMRLGGDDNRKAHAIAYEPQIVDEIRKTLLEQLSGKDFTPDKIKVWGGTKIGGIDIVVAIPGMAEMDDLGNIIRDYSNRINIDVKSNLGFFGISTISEMGNRYLKETYASLKEQQANGQLQLFPLETLEELIAIDTLLYKIDETYPVFYGATDGQILLSSQLLTKDYGEFRVDITLPEEKNIFKTIVRWFHSWNGNNGTAAVYGTTAETIMKHIHERGLFYSKK